MEFDSGQKSRVPILAWRLKHSRQGLVWLVLGQQSDGRERWYVDDGVFSDERTGLWGGALAVRGCLSATDREGAPSDQHSQRYDAGRCERVPRGTCG